MEEQIEFLKVQHHLSFEERTTLEKLLKEKVSLKKICSQMNRSDSCLKNEKKRCPKGCYNALAAQKDYQEKWGQRWESYKRGFSPEQEQLIKERIKEGKTRSAIRRELRCSYYLIEQWFLLNAHGYKGGMLSSLECRIAALEELVKTFIEVYGEKEK